MVLRLKQPLRRSPAVQKALDDAPPAGGEAARWLAQLIRDTVPDAEEGIYHQMPSWALPGGGRIFAHVAVYANHANLGVGHGTRFADPDGLLEGGGRSYRFVRVTAPDAVPKAKLVAFIRQAARFAKQDQEREERAGPGERAREPEATA